MSEPLPARRCCAVNPPPSSPSKGQRERGRELELLAPQAADLPLPPPRPGRNWVDGPGLTAHPAPRMLPLENRCFELATSRHLVRLALRTSGATSTSRTAPSACTKFDWAQRT